MIGLAVVVTVLVGAGAAAPTLASAQPADDTSTTVDVADETLEEGAPVDNETQRCIACHEDNHPGMVEDFKTSAHYDSGISCLDCHEAADDEPSAQKHFGNVISPLVTPKDCSDCHAEETEEFHDSMHDESAFYSASALSNADAGDAAMPTGWNDNVLSNNARATAEMGCQSCHGAELKVLDDENPNEPEDDVTIQGYPNQGMGRFNPDGSIGSCAACHPQHSFSLEQARSSGSCTKCHLGPDHPQKEIWKESKHGKMYHHYEDEMDLGAEQLTTDDVKAPTCAVCHVSGLNDNEATHDVSSRLKWTTETVYSYPTSEKYMTGESDYELDDEVAAHYEEQYDLEEGTLDSVPAGAPNPFAALETHRPDLYEEYVVENDEQYPQIDEDYEPTRWDSYDGESQAPAEVKRERMKSVCTECHSETWVNQEFMKRDEVIDQYNAVFTAATVKYYEPIKDQAPVASPYGESWVDKIHWEMWHHEGRQWRMGAMMGGPDYEHWHGSYEVEKDVLQLAHMKDVIESTDAGTEPKEEKGEEQESVDDESVEEQRPATVAPRLPTGIPGIGAGAMAGVGVLGVGAVGLYWRRGY
ncbi:Multiheme cytochrome [Halanaeroarchaeum sp. HSR-CO]|nr:Multiheme cytochrome [Halanaeroarchaeum sp. HSR-CO]